MDIKIDYSHVRAVSGIDPELGDQYSAWVEILPKFNGDVIARLLVQHKGTIVMQGYRNNEQQSLSKHENASDACNSFSGYCSRELGPEWSSESQGGCETILSKATKWLEENLSLSNNNLCIGDNMKGDLEGSQHIRTVEDIEYGVAFILVWRSNLHPLLKINISPEEILLRGIKDGNECWTDRHLSYTTYKDCAIYQIQQFLQNVQDEKMYFSDLHDLASRIYYAKKLLHSDLSIPREEYHMVIDIE